MAKKEPKDVGVYVRMTKSEKRDLERMAEEAARTPADALRILLRRALGAGGL